MTRPSTVCGRDREPRVCEIENRLKPVVVTIHGVRQVHLQLPFGWEHYGWRHEPVRSTPQTILSPGQELPSWLVVHPGPTCKIRFPHNERE